MISFQEFLMQADKLWSVEKSLRYGQAIMNTLHTTWAEKYNEITGGDFDCFYDDRTVRLTLDKLEKEWPQ